MTLCTRLRKFWQSLDAASDHHDEVGLSMQDLRDTLNMDKVLDHEERLDRLLAHYGLDYLIETENCGWLRVVPLLEEMNKQLTELRSKLIWEEQDDAEKL